MTVSCRRAAVAAFAALALVAWEGGAHAKIFAQWVQLGPDGTSTVRAITDESCPAVMFDGTPVPMRVRSDPEQPMANVKPAKFPVRGCEVEVPPGAIAAVLDGKVLPLAKRDPQRIMVFGDTGCRLDRRTMQDCNEPAAWPFPRITAAAATARPDLVIHVGDYHYRETPCPAANTGCANSPWGYGFDAWNADFFDPAAPLFAAAPWIMVRGNHEDCNRAGEGFMRFLDRDPVEAACRDFTGIFVARLGAFGIVVVDGAAAEDPHDDMNPMADLLRSQFEQVIAKVPAKSDGRASSLQRDAQQLRAATRERGREQGAGARVRRHHAGRRAHGARGPHPFLPGRGLWRAAPARSSWSAPAATSFPRAAHERGRRSHQRAARRQFRDVRGLRLHGVGSHRQYLGRHAVQCRGPADQSLPADRPLAHLRMINT